MKTLKIALILLWLSGFMACPGYQSKSDRLHTAIQEFHTLLKFKEYLRATDYVIPFYRKDFMNYFTRGTVSVEDYEVRGLKTDARDKVEVMVRLLLRPENSMTIRYTTIQERWAYVGNSWKLTNIKKLPEAKRGPGRL